MSGHVTLDALLPQAQDCVAGATKLERAGVLKIFALAKQPASQFIVETRVIQNGCHSGLFKDSSPRQVNISNVR